MTIRTTTIVNDVESFMPKSVNAFPFEYEKKMFAHFHFSYMDHGLPDKENAGECGSTYFQSVSFLDNYYFYDQNTCRTFGIGVEDLVGMQSFFVRAGRKNLIFVKYISECLWGKGCMKDDN